MRYIIVLCFLTLCFCSEIRVIQVGMNEFVPIKNRDIISIDTVELGGSPLKEIRYKARKREF